VELRVQDGVSGVELRAIRDGLRFTDRYLARGLGRAVEGPVEARIARRNGCVPFQQRGEALVGEAEKGRLCIDTSSPAWRWLVVKDRLAATAVAAHEYVHVWQGELGCLPGGGDYGYRWILEGMATDLGWRALRVARQATGGRVWREIRGAGAFDTNLEPLRDYERDGGRGPEYALWHFAVRRLLGDAVGAGVASPARPEVALRQFCVRIAHRVAWRTAFRRSFGLPVDRFYSRFEHGRQPYMLAFGRL
jgi:hypothetical protein